MASEQVATAQAALDDGQAGAPAREQEPEPPAATTNPVEYGVGFRLRRIDVPKSELELFLERSSGGASNTGLGIDFIRRRGNIELQLGFEYEHIQVGEGVWIKSGDDVSNMDEADYVLAPKHAPNGDKLGWFTFEFTFLNHAPINKYVAIRYGGGAGLGIINGGLYHFDIRCVNATNENPAPGCVPSGTPFNGQGQPGGDGTGAPRKYDLPPVFPVVNAIVGVQFRPTEKATINIEGGIRTLLFFGMSAAYFF